MASKSETGHAKNVANFNALIYILDGMGSAYNPAPAVLKVDSLRAQHTAAALTINQVKKAKSEYDVIINQRADLFATIQPRITRIGGTLKSLGLGSKDLEDAAAGVVLPKPLSRLLIPQTAGAEPVEVPATNNSVSQRSYDQQIEAFSKLNELVQAIAAYETNDALQAFLNSLKEANESALAMARNLREARLTRDKALYDQSAGLISAALKVKSYLKSLTGGASNPDYKQASKLKFSMVDATIRQAE